MGDYKDWMAYQKAFIQAMEIYALSKKFPSEEKYSLTGQIRRSSRSVCANLAEAYCRRRYKDYFISKLNDAETENTETKVWTDFAIACNYLTAAEYNQLIERNIETGKIIWYMMRNPEKFR